MLPNYLRPAATQHRAENQRHEDCVVKRLRALSGFYRVEVRVLSGASRKPRCGGVFVVRQRRAQVQLTSTMMELSDISSADR